MQAVVLGSTGQVGRNIVASAMRMDSYGKGTKSSSSAAEYTGVLISIIVIECGRRHLDLPSSTKREILTVDFEHLDQESLENTEASTVLIALGTNRKNAGSAEQFVKIDQHYVRMPTSCSQGCASRSDQSFHVVEFAKAVRKANISQRLVYCSVRSVQLVRRAVGAD